jgi:hypothetical protein
MFRERIAVALLPLIFSVQLGAYNLPPFALHTNDVVAFVGGSDVAAAQFAGHLEALLAVKFPLARYRNFGWEGDTVFAQPRDVGFPPLIEHLKRAEVSVIFLQYGRAEALDSNYAQTNFEVAYEKLLDQCWQHTRRVVLVTPPPFESADEPLPDSSHRNQTLATHVRTIHSLALRRKLHVVDLFSEFGGAAHTQPRLTDNGFQLSPRGHALVAKAFARHLSFDGAAVQAGDADSLGRWSQSEFEKLRATVIQKNRLWFDYWRPQNWAFLGGDRTTQPSSRDHRDPKVRWFPAEMEKYVPLIAAKELEMETVAAGIRGGGK